MLARVLPVRRCALPATSRRLNASVESTGTRVTPATTTACSASSRTGSLRARTEHRGANCELNTIPFHNEYNWNWIQRSAAAYSARSLSRSNACAP